jgi:hypothetical protein
LFLFSFTTITSGENQGEKRQIYKDARGFPFFWQGKKQPRKQYLTEWYDDNGNKRNANASIRALKQYKEMSDGVDPIQLFPTVPDLSLAEFVEDSSVGGDDAVSVMSSTYSLDDKEMKLKDAQA